MNLKKNEKKNHNKNTLDSLSPYLGKLRNYFAQQLIEEYASKSEYIYDPFAGSGTILLEGWKNGYNVIGNEMNYYAYVLTQGKLNPYQNREEALRVLNEKEKELQDRIEGYDLARVPKWVHSFFHPATLKEICCWSSELLMSKEWFLLSCLLGILHHQRPGFLSYPSSHGVPYLRDKKYPKEQFPELYEYRNVYEKLKNKIIRTYDHFPELDYSLKRKVYYSDSTKTRIGRAGVLTIITSPPYMRSLTYARDNRLRLWAVGVGDWRELDKVISPKQSVFFETMKKCFCKWHMIQHKKEKCVLVVGDINCKYENEVITLPDAIVKMAIGRYKLVKMIDDTIPEKRKMVKGNNRIKREKVMVFERV